MKRLFRRWWGPFLGGVIGAIAIILAIALSLTQTNAGRERILAITLETLGGTLRGELQVGRLEGGLFTGARMYEITLVDTNGEVMVAADSAFIRYRLASFFGGDIAIGDLSVYHPEVLLYRLPGDSLWNYQAVLQDTTPEVPGRRGRATVIEHMTATDAAVTVRLPWEPDDRLSAAEQDAELEAALSDTSRLAVETVPGGYLRTITVQAQEAEAEALTVGPDERGGTYLRILRAVADVDLYRDEPLRVRQAQGELSLREGVMRYALSAVELPESRFSSSGVVDISGEEPRYDLQLSGERLALADLQWLYPQFPSEGEASLELGIETTAESMRMRAVDLAFEAPGTRIAGDFEMLMAEDSLLFSDIDLRADPLDMQTVEGMLPTGIPVRGLTIGSVEIRTPAS